jgi:hypothetical protein
MKRRTIHDGQATIQEELEWSRQVATSERTYNSEVAYVSEEGCEPNGTSLHLAAVLADSSIRL